MHLLIALLLPLMVMRGMLPAGYMATAEDGKVRLVMCSAGLTAAGNTDSGSDGNDSQTADAGTCLFAHATSVAPPVQVSFGLASLPGPLLSPSDHSSTLPQATGPPRLAAARAPPAVLA
ncbi:MAG: hypothetical protein U1F39_02865 [Steroidobacteraceae bacterium]